MKPLHCVLLSCLLFIHAHAEMGPVSKEKALVIARELLVAIGFKRNLLYKHTEFDWQGHHDFSFGGDGETLGGEASVKIDSWSGSVVSFANQRRQFENHKGLRKGIAKRIENVATATKIGLDWAERLKIPRDARNPCGVKFTRRSTVYVGMEQKPYGFRFVMGMPYFASIEIDVTDGTLVSFFKDPPRVVESWKLNVKPESLRNKAIAEYRKAMAKIGEKKVNIANAVKVGYVGNREKNEKVDPGKGRRTLYYRLGIVFSFAKSPDGMFRDAVMFDAGDGKFLGASLYQRPPRMPARA